MMLCDVDLLKAIEVGELEVFPFEADAIQPASIDLRLGNEFRVYSAAPTINARRIADPYGPDRRQSPPFVARCESQYIIETGEFLLAHTLESIRLGPELVARIEGRSTIGRWGLIVHATAGFVDPGFQGQLTLEMFNASPSAIMLRAGMPIAQLAVQRLSSPARRPYGHATRQSKYMNQIGAVVPRPLVEK